MSQKQETSVDFRNQWVRVSNPESLRYEIPSDIQSEQGIYKLDWERTKEKIRGIIEEALQEKLAPLGDLGSAMIRDIVGESGDAEKGSMQVVEIIEDYIRTQHRSIEGSARSDGTAYATREALEEADAEFDDQAGTAYTPASVVASPN